MPLYFFLWPTTQLSPLPSYSNPKRLPFFVTIAQSSLLILPILAHPFRLAIFVFIHTAHLISRTKNLTIEKVRFNNENISQKHIEKRFYKRIRPFYIISYIIYIIYIMYILNIFILYVCNFRILLKQPSNEIKC